MQQIVTKEHAVALLLQMKAAGLERRCLLAVVVLHKELGLQSSVSQSVNLIKHHVTYVLEVVDCVAGPLGRQRHLEREVCGLIAALLVVHVHLLGHSAR